MTAFMYRLQLLLDQKEEAKKQVETELARVEQEREAQLQTLRELERRHREVTDRREQLRRELLMKPAGAISLTAKEAQDRSEYVKFLSVQIEEARKAVLAQKGVVEQCEERVRETRQLVEKARREVEVLTKHRSRQEERFARDLRTQEERALDEIGNVLYTSRRRSA